MKRKAQRFTFHVLRFALPTRSSAFPDPSIDAAIAPPRPGRSRLGR